MKKDNLWHILWLIGLYAILFIILMLIVEYKVKWEDRDLNTYLYFYDCSNNLCSSENPVANYYSKISCDNNICPYIKEKENNLLILSLNNKEYVYDYYNDKIINNIYTSYTFSNDSYIVKNDNNLYGVINREGDILIEPKYNKIIDYKNELIAYLDNSRVGITNSDNSINIEPVYDNVLLINDKYYAYLEDNNYYIALYETELPLLDEKYDYIYVTDDTILTIRDKKIDILDYNLNSKLLLKIDSYYSYNIDSEINTLNIYKMNDLLYFSVVIDENKISNYIYDIKNGRLL